MPEAGGLLVDDLTGRGATALPANYVGQHVEHGWASTIDAAQGATTDIAILLVRPGIDREHLDVGLTRGRHENHAYLAPPVDDDHAHRPASDTDPHCQRHPRPRSRRPPRRKRQRPAVADSLPNKSSTNTGAPNAASATA